MSYYIEINFLDATTDATVDIYRVSETFNDMQNALDYCNSLIVKGRSTVAAIGEEYSTHSVCLRVRADDGKLMNEVYGRMVR